MPEYQADHERRIATIEGQMQSVATKADLADLKHDLTLSFQSAIKARLTNFKSLWTNMAMKYVNCVKRTVALRV